jgi:hypothetical protein
MAVVYVPEHIDREGALGLAARWLDREANDRRDAVIVVPVRESLGHSPALSRLASRYRVETTRTISKAGLPRRVVLAVWASSDMLAKISRGLPRSVCIVQWREEESNDWPAAHDAQDLSGKAAPLETPEIADPIVRVALTGLTSDINLGNRLHQPEDHDLAVSTLQLLNRHDHGLDPDEIYRWSLAHEWPDDGAVNLKKLVEELLGGRRHRVRFRAPLGEDTYRFWEKKAAEDADGDD